MTVYLDLIFLENLFMNLVILFATNITIKNKISLIRIVVSSIVGSIYAVILYTGTIKLFSNIFFKLILSVTMTQIAFDSTSLKKLLKNLLVFYFISFTFGGAVFSILNFTNMEKLLIYNGMLVDITAIKFVAIGGVISLVIILIALKNIKLKINRKDMICNMKIHNNNKSISLQAIVDTGNFLKEPISREPVVIVEKDKLKDLIPANVLDNLQNIIKGNDLNLGEFSSKIRIIPFSSIGKENGVMLGIRMNKILIDFQDELIQVNNSIIGIYDGYLSKSNKYSALIGVELLESKGGKNEYTANIEG